MVWLKRSIFYGVAGVILLLQGLSAAGLLSTKFWFEEIVLGILVLMSSLIFEVYLGTRNMELQHNKLIEREFDNLTNIVSSELLIVSKPYIESISRNVILLIKENTLVLEDMKKFHAMYGQTLQKFPGKRFFATSDLHGSKFWDVSMARMVKEFCQNGGDLHRIFFVKTFDEPLSEEEFHILKQQFDSGVRVSVVPLDVIPHSLYLNYMVEKNASIGWEVTKEPTGSITGAKAHSNNVRAKQLVKHFEELRSQPSIKDFGELQDEYASYEKETYT